MGLDRIIQEAVHSQGWGTLTNNELGAILKVVQHAQDDLNKNGGNRSKNAYEIKVEVLIGFDNGENK